MTAPEFRVIAAQAADAATFALFMLLVPVSQFSERNPIIAGVYAAGGVAAVAAFKVGLAVLATRRRESVIVTRRWYGPTRTILLSTAAASGIVGASFNLAALMLAKGWV